MKKSIFTFTLLFVFATYQLASAQGGTQSFTVDGIPVLMRTTAKGVISARLFIKGGTANYPLNEQGIEALALSVAMQGGTTNMNKTAFNTAAEKIGTRFGSSSDLDYSEMNMTCIKPMWDKSWTLFTDAIMNPAFNGEDFDLIKQQMVAGAKQAEANPDQFLTDTAMALVFKGRGYEKNPNGTSAALTNLTADATKQYYKSIVNKSHCLLVIVGNLTKDEVTARIKATLAKLPAGDKPATNPAVLITHSAQNVIDRDIATNYLVGFMSSPAASTNDGIAMMVAMNIIYDRLFIEIRTKRGLSYAPVARYTGNAITSPYSQVYASTDSPKQVIDVIVNELDDIKKNGFNQDELTNKKQTFLTSYLMSLETSSSQSYSLGRWAMRGAPELYDEFTGKVNAVTLKDVNRVVDQNTNAIVWTYLGHKSDVQTTDFKQPTVYQNKPY